MSERPPIGTPFHSGDSRGLLSSNVSIPVHKVLVGAIRVGLNWSFPGSAGSPGGSQLEVHQETDCLIIKTSAFRLRFERVVDRWRHKIESVGDVAWSLTSVEGSPDEPCPESPAYQDLWLEDRGGARCEIQLMGQAGGTIYSAAIEVDESQSRVTFDVCARRKRPGVNVAAQAHYRIQSERDEEPGLSWLKSRRLIVDADFPEELRSMSEPLLWVADGFVVGYPARHCNVIAPEISQWRWQYSLCCAKQA